jgi:outer membrane protein assembly factor BamE
MKKLACLLVAPLLAACSSTPDSPGIVQNVSKAFDITDRLHPYRIDIRQGNMVTQEMVSQLRPGQTRDQVRFILGTPLLTDVFHADRWDYVYRLQKGNGEIQQRRLVVFFDDGKLARVGGDVVGEDPAAAAGAPSKPAPRVIEIKAPEKADAKTEDAKSATPAAVPAQ